MALILSAHVWMWWEAQQLEERVTARMEKKFDVLTTERGLWAQEREWVLGRLSEIEADRFRPANLRNWVDEANAANPDLRLPMPDVPMDPPGLISDPEPPVSP